MSFSQRPSAHYYASVHRDFRARMTETGVDVLLPDSNDDVVYATAFSNYTTERPVVSALTQQNACRLGPELERHHPTERYTAGVFFKFPGRERPCAVLGSTLRDIKSVVGHSPCISPTRVPQIHTAFPNAEVRSSAIPGQMRLANRPEELMLQREAPSISASMVSAGIALIGETLPNNTLMPTEVEIEAYVIRHERDTMNRKHEDILPVQGTADGLVYSGQRSAFPHGMPSVHRPRRGESMILSLGCRVGRLAAGSERTLISGGRTRSKHGSTTPPNKPRRSERPGWWREQPAPRPMTGPRALSVVPA